MDFDLSRLSTESKLLLLERIWDSFQDDPNAVPMTSAQTEELDYRLDELEAEEWQPGGADGIPWLDVVARIRSGNQ